MALTRGADQVSTDPTHEQDVDIPTIVASGSLLPATHRCVQVDATGANVNLNLPAANLSNKVTFYIIRTVTESNTINLNPLGGDLINGSNASIAMVNLFDFIEVRSDGVEWFVLNTNIEVGSFLSTTGGTMSGDINMGSNDITNIDNMNMTGEFIEANTLNVVKVYKEADLPDTLVAGTHYILQTPLVFTTSKTFPSGGDVEISSTNVASNTITYSGTGTFFLGTGIVGIRINVQINSSSTGTLFGVTGDSGPNSFVFWGNGGADLWDDLGTITSFGAGILQNVIMSRFDAGLKFVNTLGYFSTLTNWFNLSDQGIDFLTFDSAIEQINATNGGYAPFPNEHIFNIDNSAVVFAFVGLIQNVASGDRYFNPAGLLSTSPGVVVIDCANLADSGTSAELFLTGNTAVTDIPAAGALVEINLNANWTFIDVERLIVNVSGAVESIGRRPAKIKIDANINIEPVSSTKSLSIKTILVSPPPVDITFTNGTNLVNETSTALVDGDLISFRDTAGTLPAELRTDVVYYVVNKVANGFQVEYTPGDGAIAFTDDGTPVNSYQAATPHGSTPTNNIQSGSPRDLIPQATVPATLNSDSFLVVMNNQDAIDIEVKSGYQRYFV